MRKFWWLAPGLGLKRWILLTAIGLLLMFFGAAFFAAFEWDWADNFSEPNRKWDKTFQRLSWLLPLGVFIASIGVWRLNRAVVELLRPKGTGKRLLQLAYEQRYLKLGPHIVAMGGGNGMNRLLTGIKDHTREITAVVSVADDGGSSGRLRQDLDMLPPGDIRNCLVALSDAEPLMKEVFDYRFEDSDFKGHSFGNLFITVLAKVGGDFGSAIREANKIMMVRGKVIPATLERVSLVAGHPDGTKSTGQRRIAESRQQISSIELRPGPVKLSEDIRLAIRDADMIVYGPGSLYTSILPNLVIEDMAEELAKAKAIKVYVCNTMAESGETRGYAVSDHIRAIRQHTKPFDIVDVVVASEDDFSDEERKLYAERGLVPVVNDIENCEGEYRFCVRSLADPQDRTKHVPEKLADVLMNILKSKVSNLKKVGECRERDSQG